MGGPTRGIRGKADESDRWASAYLNGIALWHHYVFLIH